MKILFHFLAVFILIVNSSFSSIERIENLVVGSWQSNEQSFKSIDFRKNDMARVVSIQNGKSIAMHYHYRVSAYDKDRKVLSLQFLNKELYKDEYKLATSINVLLKDSNRIVLISPSGKSIQMSRMK